MNEIAVGILRQALSLTLLWCAYMAWRRYRIDALRDDLFAIRDRLFDFAAKGGIPFDDPAYRRLWRVVNALIHYASRITFARFVLPVAITPLTEQDRAGYKAWNKSLQEVSPNARKVLQDINCELATAIAGHLIKRTIPLMPVVGVLKLAYALGQGWPRLKNACLNLLLPLVPALENRALEAEKQRMRWQRRHYHEPKAA